jgi:hypothetical protein
MPQTLLHNFGITLNFNPMLHRNIFHKPFFTSGVFL